MIAAAPEPVFSFSRSPEQLKEKAIPIVLPPVILDVYEATGEVRIGLFVGNNPVNRIDPLGRFGVEADSSSGGVNGAPNIIITVTPDGHTTISNNDSPEALRMAILFGTGFTAGGLTIIGGIEAPGLTTKVLLALLGVSQHKPDPCPDQKPPLKRIHPDTTYESDPDAEGSLEYWRSRATDEIIDSLAPGQDEALKTTPDGRMLNGNTRTKALEERGFDINSLPREVRNIDDLTGEETWTTQK